MESKRQPIHSRLYQDFFDRRNNRQLLLQHLEEQARGVPYPVLSQRSFKSVTTRASIPPTEVIKETTEVHPDERLKVPEAKPPLSPRDLSTLFALRKDTPKVSPLSPKDTPRRPPNLPSKSRFRASLQSQFNPMIGKYYSQLTPFQQTLSYSSGCDLDKIQREGRELLKYSDSRAMLAALGR